MPEYGQRLSDGFTLLSDDFEPDDVDLEQAGEAGEDEEEGETCQNGESMV